MGDASNLSLREVDKLKGQTNYYVWSLKVRAIMRAEGMWTYSESEIPNPATFPTVVDGEQVTEAIFKKKKALAMRVLTLSVADDLVDLVAAHTDPSKAWKALKDAFQARDHSQILTLMGQLQTMRLVEGGSMEDYTKRARELKNKLASMGEVVADKAIVQLLLNGLPRSFETTIQTLMHGSSNLTFD
jgi:hypothetical protein